MNQAQAYALTSDLRGYLLPVMKLKFGDKCASCGETYDSYQIDHKRYADDITMYDLQLLCVDCHKVKTMDSNDAYQSGADHCPTCTCYH